MAPATIPAPIRQQVRRPAARHPVKRVTMLAGGVMLIIAAGLALPLPVPAGVFLFAGGMVLILRTSARARIRWARTKRRWPRAGNMVDRTMRRPSALRRHQRGKMQRTDERSMR